MFEFEVGKKESVYVSKIDDQKKYGKTIFGGGLLITKSKAKEKAKALGLDILGELPLEAKVVSDCDQGKLSCSKENSSNFKDEFIEIAHKVAGDLAYRDFYEEPTANVAPATSKVVSPSKKKRSLPVMQ